MQRFICVHGHFYQPLRENPWLQHTFRQESARPYHNWNERIAAECYQPNASAAILGRDGSVVETVNNYSFISFDFGPTLLHWIEQEKPETYRAILHADRLSSQRFGGHGSAMAQPYSHTIMPLLSLEAKNTEVRWGISDFEARFGRRPKGMWLPETAADMETLQVLAEHGIRFTILAPHQVSQIRHRQSAAWESIDGNALDTTVPYRVVLNSNLSIAVFIINASLWCAITGEGLLNDGERFASKLLEDFGPQRASSQIVHVATDGEMYGHHHRFGEMALAYALQSLGKRGDVALTNYGEFLEHNPPEAEVRIHENSSWSCSHGVERWRRACGCRDGIGTMDWHQEWREPLRVGLEQLRANLTDVFLEQSRGLFRDPIQARDRYVEVLTGARALSDLVDANSGLSPTDDMLVMASKLLECQRHAALMFMSCGWFFDDVSRVEPLQNLSHAARAIQLAREYAGRDPEADLLIHLTAARSNHPEVGDGLALWEKSVRPAIVELEQVIAYHAVRSLFVAPEGEQQVYSYLIRTLVHREVEAGGRVTLGHVAATSRPTGESYEVYFGVVRVDDGSVLGSVGRRVNAEDFNGLPDRLRQAADQGNQAGVVGTLDRCFAPAAFPVRYVPVHDAGDNEPFAVRVEDLYLIPSQSQVL